MFLGRLLAAALACLAVACAPSSDSTTLELWAAGREGEVVAQLIPGFEALHPGLRVDVQTLAFMGAHEKLLTAVVGESTPDVAQLGNTWVPEFAMIGALEPLDGAVSRSSVVTEASYFEGVWATNRYDGVLYGVPWYVDTRAFFYRRDLLQQVGFDHPPRTWAEWVAMMQALRASFEADKKKDRVALFLPLNEPEVLLALALQQGEPLLRDGDRFGNFRSEGFRRALAFYVSIFRAGLAPEMGNMQIGNLFDEFARGSFVFYISGPWQVGEFERRLPRALADSWTTAPLPGRAGPGSSLAFGSSLVVFKDSKKKDAAWKLVEYLSTPEVQRQFYQLTGDLPPRRETWQHPALANPHTTAFRVQLEHMEPTPPVPEWQRIQTELAIISERAARGSMSVDEAAAELDRRTDRILEKRRWLMDRKSKDAAPPAIGPAGLEPRGGASAGGAAAAGDPP